MFLLRIIKRFMFIQNFAAWLLSKVPPFVEHNIGKYAALRKAFYLTSIDQTEGDYLEFGVFTGSSFVFAGRYWKKVQVFSKSTTRFFGFDSFEGFGKVEADDMHPFYQDQTFETDYDRVNQNVAKQLKGLEFKLIKGFFDKSLRGHRPEEYGIRKSKIVFIDCDLKDPAKDVFEFVRPTLQQGTFLLMDDFYNYKGDPQAGLCGAFEDFQAKNPNIQWRRVTDYGLVGVVYVCSKI